MKYGRVQLAILGDLLHALVAYLEERRWFKQQQNTYFREKPARQGVPLPKEACCKSPPCSLLLVIVMCSTSFCWTTSANKPCCSVYSGGDASFTHAMLTRLTGSNNSSRYCCKQEVIGLIGSLELMLVWIITDAMFTCRKMCMVMS